MKTEKECPLCGKKIRADETICQHCKEYADNQYDVRLTNDSENADIVVQEENREDQKQQENREIPKSKKKSKTLIFFLIGCVLVLIIGMWSIYNVRENLKLGETEDMYWNMSVEENTVTSYSKYLVRFPDGKYADLAHEKIEKIRAQEIDEWENLKKSNDINEYYLFISDNPKSPYLAEAKNRMDSLTWLQTIDDGTAEAYKAYLSNIDLGNFVGLYSQEAKKRYDYLSQIRPLTDTELDSLKVELKAFYNMLNLLDKKALVGSLDSTFFYYNDTISNLALVDTLKQGYKRQDIDEMVYEIADSTIFAQKDQYGLVFVDLIVNSISKSIVKNTTKKKAKPQIVSSSKSDTLQIRINNKHKVIAIEHSRDAKIF